VLGNHDLSLLAVGERKREDQARVNAELREVLFAPDRDELFDWLRQRSLLHLDRTLGFLLVHAGLFPRWTIEQAVEAAREVEERLRGDGYRRLLKQLFGNKPDLWNPKLHGIDRLRASINVFTRMRYCDARGRIAFGEKGPPGTQRPGLYPWYEVPGQTKRDIRIVCGHWSTLGRFAGQGIYAIDTGCVWGGSLTALKLDSEEPEFVSIKSDRKPPAGKED
jgi:bis(5'-nucleosyl)-tetraphosphatase (symmetrical)